jgi:hypothetical protein
VISCDLYLKRSWSPLALEPVMLESLRFVFWEKLRNPSVIWRV